jgi:hypothetical protein
VQRKGQTLWMSGMDGSFASCGGKRIWFEYSRRRIREGGYLAGTVLHEYVRKFYTVASTRYAKRGMGDHGIGGCRRTFLCFQRYEFLLCVCCVEFSPVNDQFSKPWCLMLM